MNTDGSKLFVFVTVWKHRNKLVFEVLHTVAAPASKFSVWARKNFYGDKKVKICVKCGKMNILADFGYFYAKSSNLL